MNAINSDTSDKSTYTMDDVKINDHVILETNTYGNVEGTIVGYDKDKFRFRLTNVTYLDTGAITKGVRSMYNHDIKTVTILKRESSDDASNSSSQSGQSEDGTSTHDFQEIKQLAKSYECIHNFDQCYKSAIEDLNYQEYIGFIAEDSDVRLKTLHILAMSTTKKVYFFDILSLGGVPKEVKKLLESDNVKKITFDSHSLADCLYFHYKVKLEGIFDIQLADNYIGKIKTGSYASSLLSYEEIVEKYLKIPAHVYIKKPKLPHVGAVRPLTTAFEEQLATNISFMQMVSIRLYNNIMGPLFKAGSQRANSLRHLPDIYESILLSDDNSLNEELIEAFNDCEV